MAYGYRSAFATIACYAHHTNARPELLLKVGAQRTLEAVSCSTSLGKLHGAL